MAAASDTSANLFILWEMLLSIHLCSLGNICSLRVFRSLNPITASPLLEQGGRSENHKNFL